MSGSSPVRCSYSSSDRSAIFCTLTPADASQTGLPTTAPAQAADNSMKLSASAANKGASCKEHVNSEVPV
ncbi:hypothetical protein ABBQ38_009568 [Trebouxia sp. C0009 RCD-2024]